LRFLLKRINLEKPGQVDISDKVFLEYFEMESREEDIGLTGENPELSIRVEGGGYHKEEKEHLSVIIQRLNEKFQTDFSESAKVALEQVSNKLKGNDNLKKRAQANSLDDFRFAVKNEFKDTVVESYAENTEFYGRILNDEEFRDKVLDLLLVDIYNSLKKK
jgi:type I restriction enzyme R subunit